MISKKKLLPIVLCVLGSLVAAERVGAFTTGTVSGDSGKPVPGKHNVVSSDTPLPAGPGPGGPGAKIPPNDYGLCGLLGLSGNFGNATVARIAVGSNGYYEIHREWESGTQPPTVDWTCVRLTEFKGAMPSNSLFRTDGPHPLTSNGALVENKLWTGSNSYGNACPWAGVAGNLSASHTDQELRSVAVHDENGYPTGITYEDAQGAKGVTISAFAFCSWFKPSVFTWSFYKNSPDLGDGFANHFFLQVRPKEFWCYMQGVATGGPDGGGSFTARLGIDKSPPAPYDAGGPIYFEDVDMAGLYWNCLPLDQPGY
jgi:hypothetical protein